MTRSLAVAGHPEFDVGITLVIRSIFPNVVVQQIANTLAARQINPDKAHGFELVWMHFGHADDEAQLRAIRLK